MQLLALVKKKSALIALLPFLFPLEQYSTLVIAEISWIPLLAASPEWWMVHRTGVLHNSSIELITEDHKRSINYKTTFFFAVCLKQTQIALWRTIGYRTSLAPINFTDLQGIYLALLDGIFIALFFSNWHVLYRMKVSKRKLSVAIFILNYTPISMFAFGIGCRYYIYNSNAGSRAKLD